MRLGHRAHAAEVGRLPSGRAGQQLGQRAGGGGDVPGPRVIGQQVGDLAAQHGGARRLEADDRHAGAQRRTERPQAAPQLTAGAVELAGGDPRQPAAHGPARDLHRVPGRLEHPYGGLADLGGEVVGERVTHSSTGVPAARDVPARAANQARKVCAANRGSGRRASIPPSRLASPASPGARSVALASPGAREASQAQRGSQPSV